MEEKKENRQLNPEGAVDRSAWVLCEQQEGLWAGLGGQVFFRMEGKKDVWKKECPVQGEELPSRLDSPYCWPWCWLLSFSTHFLALFHLAYLHGTEPDERLMVR